MKKDLYLKGLHLFFGRARKSEKQKRLERANEIRERNPGRLSKLFEPIIESEKIVGSKGARERIYSADVTFWAMLSQSFQGACLREAVREVQASFCLRSVGNKNVGAGTGSYSDARKRLPASSIQSAHERVCQKMSVEADPLNGPRILIVDGSTVHLEDTKANQRKYPQSSYQKIGCGFPTAQLLGLFDLNKGSLEHFCLSKLHLSESELLDRKLVKHLKEGDVLMADRGFCSYWRFAQLQEKGVDALMRLNRSRKWPKSMGNDFVFIWKRPGKHQRPAHVSEQQWQELPQQIQVRYICHTIRREGFRDHKIFIVSTLIKHNAQELADLYLKRWAIELCFDDLKTTMKIDFIRAKSPEMARKVLMITVIAYNLVRLTILRAAKTHERSIHQTSFKGALDSIRHFGSSIQMANRRKTDLLIQLLYKCIACDIIAFRPNRIEPRVRKRRPKAFDLMQENRIQLRAQIMVGLTS